MLIFFPRLLLLEYNDAIESLKKQAKTLREQKADRTWVLQELEMKADISYLDNFVTQDEIDDALDDFSRILDELQHEQVLYAGQAGLPWGNSPFTNQSNFANIEDMK